MFEQVQHPLSHRQGQAGLASAARSREGQQAHIRLTQSLTHHIEIVVAADQPRRLQVQIVRTLDRDARAAHPAQTTGSAT